MFCSLIVVSLNEYCYTDIQGKQVIINIYRLYTEVKVVIYVIY